MKLGPIIDWLKAGELGFATIDGVNVVADLDTRPAALPAAFVVPGVSEFVAEQEGSGLIVLEDRFSFEVVIVVGVAQASGRNRDELAYRAAKVIDRMLGWTSDPSVYRPVIPVSARLAGIGGGRVSWAIRFRTASRLRKQGLP